MKPTRRDILKGIGAVGATLTFTGHASASDGRAQYILTTNGNGVRRRIESAGFEVRQELADGGVLIAFGPESSEADLRGVNGVQSTVRDVRLALERPAVEELAGEEELEAPTFYEEFLWDKQVTESLEANQIATGEGAQIAVIDTGVDYLHPDLLPNLDTDAGRLFREGEVFDGEMDDIVVGRPTEDEDLLFEIEFVEQHVADDVQGHGTHVAGIAAASADEGAIGTGVAGTAPDADVISHRVFWWVEDDDVPEGWSPTTTTGDVLAAIDYAAAQGYDAANLSLGTAPLPPEVNRESFVRAYRQVIQSAVQRGTVVCASAGNAETNLQQGGLFSLPNSVQGAMSVSATAPNDELAFYSNFGTNEIDVGAPGGGYETLEKTLDPEADVEWPFPLNLVYSTTSPRVEGVPYGWKAGTSMAAPQVAGTVALIRELDGKMGSREVEQAIKRGTEGENGRGDPELGAGRINALNTVESIDR